MNDTVTYMGQRILDPVPARFGTCQFQHSEVGVADEADEDGQRREDDGRDCETQGGKPLGGRRSRWRGFVCTGRQQGR